MILYGRHTPPPLAATTVERPSLVAANTQPTYANKLAGITPSLNGAQHTNGQPQQHYFQPLFYTAALDGVALREALPASKRGTLSSDSTGPTPLSSIGDGDFGGGKQVVEMGTQRQLPSSWFYEGTDLKDSDSHSPGSHDSAIGHGHRGAFSPLHLQLNYQGYQAGNHYGLSNNRSDPLDDHEQFFSDEFNARLMLNDQGNDGQPAVPNVTESVEVPSSEHVAEIVGRQGCKIKALRAKTNTYIKTPVRGEEPLFVVTGRQEDVLEAKREIESAAEHFTQIRASRRHSQGGMPAPGHVTAYVRVPLRVVGLVVGPKGATIKRIQQDTHTYIITPSREREPIFEVTGLPHNVDAARHEIQNHIYQRTGNLPITDPNASLTTYELQAATVQHQQNQGTNYIAQSNGSYAYGIPDYMQQQQSFPARRMNGMGPIEPLRNGYGTLGSCGFNGFAGQPNKANTEPAANSVFFKALELMSGGNAPFGNNNNQYNGHYGGALLRSTSGPQQFHHFQPQQRPDPYQSWSNCTTNGGNELSSLHNLFSSGQKQNDDTSAFFNDLIGDSSSPGGLGTSSSGVSSNGGGLSSNSTSRDEGLGDSPTNSFGKLTSDPYHLMISSIWSDLDTTVTPRDATVETPQLASA